MPYDKATGRGDRYGLIVHHGEFHSVYYIVDHAADEPDQPAVIESSTDKRTTLANLERYNRAHKGRM